MGYHDSGPDSVFCADNELNSIRVSWVFLKVVSFISIYDFKKLIDFQPVLFKLCGWFKDVRQTLCPFHGISEPEIR